MTYYPPGDSLFRRWFQQAQEVQKRELLRAFGVPPLSICVPEIESPVTPQPLRCDGCGRAATVKGPDSQLLCAECDKKRIAPPPGPDEPVQGECEACHTESFVVNCGGQKLCTYCEELRALTPAPTERGPAPYAFVALIVASAFLISSVLNGLPSWTAAVAFGVFVAIRLQEARPRKRKNGTRHPCD